MWHDLFLINTLQHTATFWCVRVTWLIHSTHYNTLQHTATHCDTLPHTATHCNTLQHTSPVTRPVRSEHRPGNGHRYQARMKRHVTLQRTATCCNILQLTTHVTWPIHNEHRPGSGHRYQARVKRHVPIQFALGMSVTRVSPYSVRCVWECVCLCLFVCAGACVCAGICVNICLWAHSGCAGHSRDSWLPSAVRWFVYLFKCVYMRCLCVYVYMCRYRHLCIYIHVYMYI